MKQHPQTGWAAARRTMNGCPKFDRGGAPKETNELINKFINNLSPTPLKAIMKKLHWQTREQVVIISDHKIPIKIPISADSKSQCAYRMGAC